MGLICIFVMIGFPSLLFFPQVLLFSLVFHECFQWLMKIQNPICNGMDTNN